jgi:RimJ/RimL family protein N-acetyltransferase
MPTTPDPAPFPPNFIIKTARLQISPFIPTDPIHCNFLVQLWNTEDFINSCGKTSIDTQEKASSFLQRRVLADYARNGYGMYLVAREGENNAKIPIGTVSLMKGAPPDPHYLAPDIGYAILPWESGKGYATEAAKGLIQYARAELGIDAVFGFCAADDKRSCRVLEKVGLKARGVKALSVFGGKESAVYALIGMSANLGVYGLHE